MSTITDFENSIASAKDEFFEQFKIMLDLVKDEETTSEQVRDCLTDLHNKGANYFNLFGRSITEYGLENYKLNVNIRNSKIDDSINISNTIVKYWGLLKSLKEKYEISAPKPGERAYSSIQLFLKTYESAKANELKLKFLEVNLPVSGFDSKRKFIDMTKKQQVTFSVVAGLVLLIGLAVIALIVECPTIFQDNIFKTILALAAAAFAAAIPGLINVKYREAITASGALAVFVIVFLFKPAEISDFNPCPIQSISGTVYFGENPQQSVELRFLKLNQSTMTDNFGTFNLRVDFSRIDDVLKVQLKYEEHRIDTLISLNKSELLNSLDLYVRAFCVKCIARDQGGTVVNVKNKCSADEDYIKGYTTAFINASEEQGRTANCENQ